MVRTLMLVAALAWSAGAVAQDTGEKRTWEEHASESIADELDRVRGALAGGNYGGRELYKWGREFDLDLYKGQTLARDRAIGGLVAAKTRAEWACDAVRIMRAMGVDDETIGEASTTFCDNWKGRFRIFGGD